MGEDDGAVGADAREARDLIVASDGEHAVTGAGAVQQHPGEDCDDEHNGCGEGHHPDPGVAEGLEGGGHFAGRSRVHGVEVTLDDQPGAEGGDEGVHLELGGHHSVEQAHQGGSAEPRGHSQGYARGVTGHGGGGDQAAQRGDVTHREVQRPAENHHGLADGDEAEQAGAGEDVDDASAAEQVFPVGRQERRTSDQGAEQGDVDQRDRGQG